MTEPKYLKFDGEELILSKEEIDCMINALKSKLDKTRLNEYVIAEPNGTMWQYIIARINELNGNGDDEDYPLYSLDLPMPDYTKLK